MITTEPQRHRVMKVSRRQALRLMGGAGAAALLAACGSAGDGGSSGSSGAGPGSGSGSGVASLAPTPTVGRADGSIKIVNTGAKLPTEKVTFRWIDSGDLKALFYRKFFVAYQEAHPNITIQYDPLPWTEIEKIVSIGIQNGNAHDTFQIPPNFTAAQAVREGWVAPIEDIVPNFAEWQARFPFGSFLEGVHVFNGKTYTFPVTSNKRYGTLTLYNLAHLQAAGYDPATKPLTWDEFRAAAKKVTEAGKGQYYGLILGGKQTNVFSGLIRNLARMAGAAAGNDDIDYRTGQHVLTSDQYLAAIDLLLAIKADNSIFPGSLSLNGPQARSQMPQGVAGMILEGPWNIPQWPQENPDFKFGVASQPIPNSGKPVPLTFTETGANQQWVYAKSPNKAIAGDIFAHMGTLEGQTAIVVASGGNLRAIFPEADERAQQTQQLNPLASKALDLFQEQIRLAPTPLIRNPEVAQVLLEEKTIKPDFGETVQGIFTGQLRDPKAAMKDLQDRTEAELERAIKAAADKGAKVSRDDWRFANWDPTKDYTQADYDALKR